MTLAIFWKLLVLIAVVSAGWYAGRTPLMRGPEPVKAISTLAFYLLIPALLFRSTAKVDLQHLPWSTLLAFFVPVILFLLAVYSLNRFYFEPEDPAVPAARGMICSFGNTLQVGLPFVAAIYGDEGLSVLVAIISLHALTLLSVSTVLVEVDLARARHEKGGSHLKDTLKQTVRNTIIHPVILPVLAGLVWNLLGLPVPQPMDESLQLLASGVVPLCLVMIGLSLAHHGVQGYLKVAFACTAGKMLVMPALVLLVAHWGLGLSGMPLSVIVMVATLPTGSNALLFAQRYESQVPVATAANVVGTVSFAALAPLWLTVLTWL